MLYTGLKYYCVSILLLALTLSHTDISAQPHRPFVFFDAEKGEGGRINTSLAQGPNGMIFIVNSDGLVRYAGSYWEQYLPNSDNRTISEVTVTGSGKAFVAGTNIFGYVEIHNGKKRFVSLIEHFSEDGDTLPGLFFGLCSLGNKIFVIHGDTVLVWDDLSQKATKHTMRAPFDIMNVDGRIWITDIMSGLFELKAGHLRLLSRNRNFFLRQTPVTAMPFGDGKVLTCNRRGEMFKISLAPFRHEPFEFDFKDQLKSSSITGGLSLRNGNFLLLTEDEGVFHFSPKGNLIEKIDKDDGLNGNAFNDALQDREGNVWLATYRGIMMWEIESPIGIIGRESGLEGAIYDMAKYRDKIYLATSEGLLKNKKNTSQRLKFEKQEYPGTVCFGLKTTPEGLIIGALDTWVLDNEDSKPRHLSDYKYIYFDHYSWKGRDYVICAGPRRLAILRLENGKWQKHWESNYLHYEFDGAKAFPKGDHVNFWLSAKGKVFSAEWRGKDQLKPDFRVASPGVTMDLPKGRAKIIKNNEFLEVFVNESLYRFYPEIKKFRKSGLGISGLKDLSILNGDSTFYWNKKDGQYKIFDDLGHPAGIFSGIDWGRYPVGELNNWLQLSEKRLLVSGQTGLLLMDGFSHQNTEQDSTLSLHIAHVYPHEDTLYLNGIDQQKHVFPYSQNSIAFDYSAPTYHLHDKVSYYCKLEGFDESWVNRGNAHRIEYMNLFEGKYTFQVMAVDAIGRVSPVQSFSFGIDPPYFRTGWAYLVYGISFLALILGSVKWYNHRLMRDNERLELMVSRRTFQLEKKRKILESQKYDLAEKSDALEKANKRIVAGNKEIRESLTYASYLQKAFIPDIKRLRDSFADAFVLHLPKQQVSGDFYWLAKEGGKHFLAVLDCTGHGVPGAFMSIIGNNLLEEIIRVNGETSVDNILSELDRRLKEKFALNDKTFEDGMEIGLCRWDPEINELRYAGARIKLSYFADGELQVLKGDRRSIGERHRGHEVFTEHVLKIDKPTSLYLYTDGFRDQFGGPRSKKFLDKRLRKVLSEIQDLPMEEQENTLMRTFIDWKQEESQVDDVLVLGFQLVPQEVIVPEKTAPTTSATLS
ncbi:hypothetical protein FUAX_26920 [Fulvitalea axinellae]|uniref:PPM-type phosphatase domain-containing protein n=1 Tax=Fulvitalea axinellae TaxID=1182444 RepID=A0AAU9DCW3_9BACT|nr:hypothetical protein FUAX_26920 [Fulvitalea axinellae]